MTPGFTVLCFQSLSAIETKKTKNRFEPPSSCFQWAQLLCPYTEAAITPSLKNTLLSVVAGGIVLAGRGALHFFIVSAQRPEARALPYVVFLPAQL